jgi:putative GTP pyrophosphokinase
MPKSRRLRSARLDLKPWLEQIRPKHDRLTDAVEALLKNLLNTQKIDFLSVEGRTKSHSSILEKCDRKNYNNPKEQLTDISGIRIITFLESQVRQIVDLIRINFNVDEPNSLDRAEILGSDRMGYRSVHFVCKLSSSRRELPEYSGLQHLKFEIQIRTVLQHAWAELAHDRSFKLGLELPTNIQRKLNLHAGMLEIVDSAFDEIAREVDEYRSSLSNRRFDQIADADINSISIEQYLSEISKIYGIKFEKTDVPAEVIEELRYFGLKTIGDLVKFSTPDLISEISRVRLTGTGFLRDVMMLTDIEKYFSKKPSWGVINTDEAKPLVLRYGADKVARLLNIYDIELGTDDGHWHDDRDEILAALKRLDNK